MSQNSNNVVGRFVSPSDRRVNADVFRESQLKLGTRIPNRCNSTALNQVHRWWRGWLEWRKSIKNDRKEYLNLHYNSSFNAHSHQPSRWTPSTLFASLPSWLLPMVSPWAWMLPSELTSWYVKRILFQLSTYVPKTKRILLTPVIFLI